MKKFFLLIVILAKILNSFAQETANVAKSYLQLANQMIEISSQQNQSIKFEFTDSQRIEWRRTPGPRKGIALYQMDVRQKKILHELMSSTLSTSGYNKVTHILFNEDLSKEFDPETGLNRYWFAIYGTPAAGNKWGWKLEGHHLSLNITMMGNGFVSVTPFELGSYPAIVEKDTVRSGFRNLSQEIDLGFQLINSLTDQERTKAIINKTRPNEKLLGEFYDISATNPVGLPVKELNKEKQAIVLKLIEEYLGNTRFGQTVNYSSLYFGWWGPTDNSKTYWYRLHSKEFIIDFENIGNHIHCLFRFLNKDFGN